MILLCLLKAGSGTGMVRNSTEEPARNGRPAALTGQKKHYFADACPDIIKNLGFSFRVIVNSVGSSCFYLSLIK